MILLRILKFLLLLVSMYGLETREELKKFPTRVNSTEQYKCYSDVCYTGLQTCNDNYKQCDNCEIYHAFCMTEEQKANCTKYCVDQWVQNHDFSSSQDGSCNCNKTAFIAVISAIAALLFLLILCLFIAKTKGYVHFGKTIQGQTDGGRVLGQASEEDRHQQHEQVQDTNGRHPTSTEEESILMVNGSN